MLYSRSKHTLLLTLGSLLLALLSLAHTANAAETAAAAAAATTTCDKTQVPLDPFWKDVQAKYSNQKYNRTFTYKRGFELAVYDTEERLECSDSWVNIPGVHLWSYEMQGLVYLCALFYCFLGVQIISDVFMSAVEVITASEKTVHSGDEEYNVRVWNPTVANLTLMALGSSAPEILLSVIETGQTLGSMPGELGPSTIVGSAAFNLLVITAVCIVGLPTNESKSVTEFGVFCVTAAWSLWAYVWLVIVLAAWTPGEVTLAEAILTCIFMPAFVAHSYAEDQKWFGLFGKYGDDDDDDDEGDDLDSEENGRSNSGLNRVVGVYKNDKGGPTQQMRGVNKGEVLGIINMLKRDEDSANASKLMHSSSFIARHLNSLSNFRDSMKKRLKAVAPSALFFKMNVRRRMAGKTHHMHHDTHTADIDKIVGKQVAAADSGKGGSNKSITSPGSAARRRSSAASMSITSGDNKKFSAKWNGSESATSPDSVQVEIDESERQTALIEFTTEDFVVVESGGAILLPVSCSCVPFEDVHVTYETIDGMAKAGEKYEKTEGELLFRKGSKQLIQSIKVPIIDNDTPEPNMHFHVQLTLQSKDRKSVDAPDGAKEGTEENAKTPSSPASPASPLEGGGAVGVTATILPSDKKPAKMAVAELGVLSMANVEILDDDDPGMFEFNDRLTQVLDTENKLFLKVHRVQGNAGECTVDYFTTDGSARAGIDYEAASGTLKFEAGETEADIVVRIILRKEMIMSEERNFHVLLRKPTGMATLGRISTTIVKIVEDEELANLTDRVNESLVAAAERYSLPKSAEWIDQFKEAVVLGAAIGDDGQAEPLEFSDYMMHFLSIFWKVLFAFVPPTGIGRGWPTFVVSLMMIGAVTAIVKEFASLFGCAVGLKDSVTAITFVALGTSLPDTFASKQAACEADDADAAIGNVTGSNSVNVFLGLGIPWMMGTLYFLATNEAGGHYCVPAAGLVFSVVVFAVAALSCLALLYVRRIYFGGELGGETVSKWYSGIFLCFMWFFYVLLSSLKEYDHIDGLLSAKTYDSFGCSCDMSWSKC